MQLRAAVCRVDSLDALREIVSKQSAAALKFRDETPDAAFPREVQLVLVLDRVDFLAAREFEELAQNSRHYAIHVVVVVGRMDELPPTTREQVDMYVQMGRPSSRESANLFRQFDHCATPSFFGTFQRQTATLIDNTRGLTRALLRARL